MKFILSFINIIKKNIGYILMPLILCYFEIALKLVSNNNMAVSVESIILSILIGLLIDFILIIFYRIGKIIFLISFIISMLIYLIEAYLYRMFSTYFSLKTIKDMSALVTNQYNNEIFKLIFENVLIIFIYLIPVIVIVIFWKKITFNVVFIGYRLIYIGVLYLITITYICSLNIIHNDAIIEHIFSASTSKYGLNTSIIFELLSENKHIHIDIKQKINGELNTNQYNVLDLNFKEITNNDEYGTSINNLNNYVNGINPSNKNNYTGIFKNKNVILICAESFFGRAVSKELTPTLYRMLSNGFRFKDYYNSLYTVSTASGEFQFLTGFVPIYGVESTIETVGKNNYLTLASQLKREGYKTHSFHNGEYDYYDRDITHENLGFDNFMAFGKGLEKLVNNRTDYELFDKTYELYKNDEKFCTYYMTYDGHLPYDSVSYLFDKYKPKVNSLYGKKYSELTINYLVKLASFDDALTNLIEKLKDDDKLKDTVFCINADHYPYGLKKQSYDYLSELCGENIDNNDLKKRDKNDLVIWCESLEDENFLLDKDINDPTCAIDILPTMSNLLALDFDSRLMPGRDVFSDREPLVIWENYSFMTKDFYYDKSNDKVYEKTDIAVNKEMINNYLERLRFLFYYCYESMYVDYFDYLFGNDVKDIQYSFSDEDYMTTYKNVLDLIDDYENVKDPYSMTDLLDISQLTSVKFGKYEQDGKTTDGKEEIVWIVAKKIDNGVLLLSKYILDASKYCIGDNNRNWEKSYVRDFLNNVFYNEAFTTDEKSIIRKSKDGYNDYVSVMSFEELDACFGVDKNSYENKLLAAKATNYARSRDLYEKIEEGSWYNHYSNYWLKDNMSDLQYSISAVKYNGHISISGENYFAKPQGIRPVILITW